jgi:rubrerythrin
MKLARVQLAHVAALVLSLAASGCCQNVEDNVWTSQLDDVFADEALTEVRDGSSTDEERCEAGCQKLVYEAGEGEYDRTISCVASGGDAALPTWDPGQTEVTVVCEVEYREPGFCTGRRPLGHHEQTHSLFVGSARGAHFADMAHLEAASVRAFIELAEWLERREAPSELIERCRAAAADEVVHAELMAALAQREGAEVAPAIADPGSDELLAVALHNAVEGCVHEAFAAVIAAHQAWTCDELELRETFARIADDELRHGQLAWDLHAWLIDQLDEVGRAKVEAAQQSALAQLASSTRTNAAQAPEGLGWPSPEVAAGMADRFAALVGRPLAVAA